MRRACEVKRPVDGIEMRRRHRFELPEPLGGSGGKVLEMSAEAVVEILAPCPHHGVDRLDVAGDVRVQLVRVGRDPIDHAVPVLPDQIVERLQIFAHPARLPGQRSTSSAAVLADDGVERGHLRAERVVNAARAGGDRRGGLARPLRRIAW